VRYGKRGHDTCKALLGEKSVWALIPHGQGRCSRGGHALAKVILIARAKCHCHCSSLWQHNVAVPVPMHGPLPLPPRKAVWCVAGGGILLCVWSDTCRTQEKNRTLAADGLNMRKAV